MNLVCSYCMEGVVEALPAECPKCGHALSTPVRAADVFSDDPEKMMAGMALELERENDSKPPRMAMIAPLKDDDGIQVLRRDAEKILREIFRLGDAWELVPTDDAEYAKSLQGVVPDGVEAKFYRRQRGLVSLKVGDVRVVKQYFLFREIVN